MNHDVSDSSLRLGTNITSLRGHQLDYRATVAQKDIPCEVRGGKQEQTHRVSPLRYIVNSEQKQQDLSLRIYILEQVSPQLQG